MKKSQDRRWCRWYGHKTYIHESQAFAPPQITVLCQRCNRLLAGPFAKWEGRMLPAAEMLVRNLYKATPMLSHFLNKA